MLSINGYYYYGYVDFVIKHLDVGESETIRCHTWVDESDSGMGTLNNDIEIQQEDLKASNLPKTEVPVRLRRLCFVPGTKVLTTTGLKNIEDIKAGEKVYTRNEETNKIEIKEVKEPRVNDYNSDLIKVYTERADVTSTINHKYYVKNKGWTRADELKEGDILINNNNVEQKITELERIENNKTIKVYNLRVEDNHNYFVGLDSVLVHNGCCILPGTQVPIDLKGNTKSIEDIKVGDTVVAYNDKTGKNELRKVTETFIHKDVTDIVTIKFKDGSTLVQNMYHPIYTKEGWKSLTRYERYEYLENNDVVKTEEGWKEIESIDINLNSKPTDLYTINVEGLDNFYANGTMIHDNEY